MLGIWRRINLFNLLSVLTLIFIGMQILGWCIVMYHLGAPPHMQEILNASLVSWCAVLGPLLQLFASQIIVYLAYIYVLWYVSITIGQQFSLLPRSTLLLAVLLWLDSLFAILALNAHYSTHSIFSLLLRDYLFKGVLTEPMIWVISMLSGGVCLGAMVMAFIIMCVNIGSKRHSVRDGFMLLFLLILLFLTQASLFRIRTHHAVPIYSQPNVIFVSFDASHPDFLGFHGLEKAFKHAGYRTIYATDDRRYNDIAERYRFDRVVGPPATIADYFISQMNDFPLSNLIAPSALGKILFPYNYANHASAHTYAPMDFLKQINHVIRKERDHPFFLVVQFNMIDTPFYWFNDQLPYNADEKDAYENAVAQSDRMLKRLMALLKQNKCLGNAVVVLRSNHDHLARREMMPAYDEGQGALLPDIMLI